MLRTATRGIGTDSYRAPEVNGIHGYDPSAADVWSLGVTLFFMVASVTIVESYVSQAISGLTGNVPNLLVFQVGIEDMVKKAHHLDPYSKQLLAPLGILFPFPLHCSKLDCYLREEKHVQQGLLMYIHQFIHTFILILYCRSTNHKWFILV